MERNVLRFCANSKFINKLLLLFVLQTEMFFIVESTFKTNVIVIRQHQQNWM